ncbi:cytochrome-c peroxidase [Haliangium sp.]|uniref:cytochrome-c peroxidase n=1 Tax=Haliangium sp. TaxID=2663208 RepID=UPI003D0B5ABB
MRTSIVGAVIALFTLTALAAVPGCKEDGDGGSTDPKGPTTPPPTDVAVPEAPPIPDPPQGLAELSTPSPEANPNTPDKVALGELLFFDTRLSDTGEFACLTCHLPQKGWADGKKVSTKADGKDNSRHSPTMYNVGYAQDWYWDGRKKTLEDQILAAWTGQVGGTPEKVIEKLARVPEYKVRFQRAFNEGPSADNVPKAIAAFLRIRLRAGDSPWDRYKAGDEQAVSDEVVKGSEIFMGKAGCALCHAPPLFTDMAYHNVGVGYEGVAEPDVGRFKVSSVATDTGAFKTPGLRGVALSAPYFHDGGAATLEEAVDFMLAGGYRKGNEHIDERLKPVELTDEERSQLMAFINALTPSQTSYEYPVLP